MTNETVYTPERLTPIPGVILVLAVIGACCVGWFIGGLMEVIDEQRSR
jgi:hypothetical protein